MTIRPPRRFGRDLRFATTRPQDLQTSDFRLYRLYGLHRLYGLSTLGNICKYGLYVIIILEAVDDFLNISQLFLGKGNGIEGDTLQ